MGTIPIPSIVADSLGADSVLYMSAMEITSLDLLAQLAEQWIEARIRKDVLRMSQLDGEMGCALMDFRRAERRRRREEKRGLRV